MTHVAIMNFMYDIPVKIFSVHLTLIAFLIFSTDLKRFINVFIKNKPTQVYDYYNPIKDKTYHKTIFWIKVILTLFLSSLFFVKGTSRARGKNNNAKPYLYGVWEVEHYIKEGDTLKPLITDSERWRYLIIEQKDRALVKTMNDKNHWYKFETDTINKKAMIYSSGTKSETYNFKYNLVNDKTLILKGNLYFYDLNIKLKRKEFLLDSREFHWINETPFNR
jgi:hypothetical protein